MSDADASASAPPPAGDDRGPSKKALKKAAAAAEKARSKAERAAALEAKMAALQAAPDALAHRYGDAEMVQSKEITGRAWTRVDALNETLKDREVLLRGRVHNVRGKGKSAFIVLRQQTATVQVTLFVDDVNVSKGMVKWASALTRESVVDVKGLVVHPEVPIESCTQKEVEVVCREIHCISRSDPELPFLIEDASRPDSAFEAEDTQFVRVLQDTRLNNRVMDLRTPANNAIFKIQSGVGTLFREALLRRNFTEIHTPKLIAGASEGGAAVFKLDYMQVGPACLAQSPQLYKQMAIMGDLEGVFEIGPVFRAEDSNTHRHLCEFTGLDMEMTIKEHYDEVLDVLDELFVSMFDGLNERFKREIGVVNEQHPFEPLQYCRPSLRLTFEEGVKMLQEAGEEVDPLGDIGTETERVLGRLVKEKYGTDFYMLTRYPLNARPFYTMPAPDDPNYTNSFDIFIRGQEIISGAQRIHDPKLLAERAEACGIELPTIQPYIDSFKYGAMPHGGCGVGLERVAMLFLNLPNIRKTSMFPRDPKRLTP
jgi:aspartyl-tRNA synthetase